MQERIIPQRCIAGEKKGVLKKYLERVVGTKNLFYVLKYELLTVLFTNLPGAIGLFSRHIFYPALFGSVQKGVQFGRGIILRGGLKADIGSGTILDDFVVIDCKSEYKPGVILGRNCLIGRNTKLSTGYTGFVKIGNHTIIGENCIIHGPGGIEIGDNVLVSDGTILNAGAHIYAEPEKNILSQGITAKGIKINDDVWLGTAVIVKDGVTIGKGSVVEAGSLVDSQIPENSIVSGVPAEVIGSRR